jgi:hypothetical protein
MTALLKPSQLARLRDNGRINAHWRARGSDRMQFQPVVRIRARDGREWLLFEIAPRRRRPGVRRVPATGARYRAPVAAPVVAGAAGRAGVEGLRGDAEGGMNIKEHIEAGHYPTDEKGRALVPVGCEKVATICATDAPGNKPILGFIASDNGLSTVTSCTWDEHGNNCPSQPRACWVDLLPPPPRKVPVRARIECTPEGFAIKHLAKIGGGGFRYGEVIELTGETEEPWS